MDEMRKKWLDTELKCKDLESKLNLEKSIYQRKINELKYYLLFFFLIFICINIFLKS